MGFDPSRAAERAADPAGWRFEQVGIESVYDVIAQRRDIRKFRPDPVPSDVLRRILAATHMAPSVGLMQPWRIIVVSDIETRTRMRQIAQAERLRQAEKFPDRSSQFLDQKIEGIIEAPLGVVICCDHGDPDEEILGRGTIRETDIYSTSCAVQNFWLAARAEGLGVGWVSFYKQQDVRQLLNLPDRVDAVAWLCVGWPDERPVRPGLEAAGWSSRIPVDDVLMHESWDESLGRSRRSASLASAASGGNITEHSAAVTTRPSAGNNSLDREAAIQARDRLDQLVKPTGSLGALEPLLERWALLTGSTPRAKLKAGVLIFAGDHGHVAQGTALYQSKVTAQVAQTAAAGKSAAGVLALQNGYPLQVVDVGLVADTPTGVANAKIDRGTRDVTVTAAMTSQQLDLALQVGRDQVDELHKLGIDCLALGEIGMGNTTTTALLASLLLDLPAAVTVGRGAGMDAAGLERKREAVSQAIALHGNQNTAESMSRPDEAKRLLASAGGFEFAALVGAILQAQALKLPVILDGYAVGVAGLLATWLSPLAGECLFASHRSAEQAHAKVLIELGLEPILDLRLRLGEASGALLALPVIQSAGALHSAMGTFDESGIEKQ